MYLEWVPWFLPKYRLGTNPHSLGTRFFFLPENFLETLLFAHAARDFSVARTGIQTKPFRRSNPPSLVRVWSRLLLAAVLRAGAPVPISRHLFPTDANKKHESFAA